MFICVWTNNLFHLTHCHFVRNLSNDDCYCRAWKFLKIQCMFFSIRVCIQLTEEERDLQGTVISLTIFIPFFFLSTVGKPQLLATYKEEYLNQQIPCFFRLAYIECLLMQLQFCQYSICKQRTLAWIFNCENFLPPRLWNCGIELPSYFFFHRY